MKNEIICHGMIGLCINFSPKEGPEGISVLIVLIINIRDLS